MMSTNRMIKHETRVESECVSRLLITYTVIYGSMWTTIHHVGGKHRETMVDHGRPW